MTISEIKTEFVLATLGKGTKVVACDFATLRMNDCGEMTVNAINAYIEKGTVKFFSVVNNE
jgi:hypothetical protein